MFTLDTSLHIHHHPILQSRFTVEFFFFFLKPSGSPFKIFWDSKDNSKPPLSCSFLLQLIYVTQIIIECLLFSYRFVIFFSLLTLNYMKCSKLKLLEILKINNSGITYFHTLFVITVFCERLVIIYLSLLYKLKIFSLLLTVNHIRQL